MDNRKRSCRRSKKNKPRMSKRPVKCVRRYKNFSGVHVAPSTLEDELLYMFLDREEKIKELDLINKHLNSIVQDSEYAPILKNVIAKLNLTKIVESELPKIKNPALNKPGLKQEDHLSASSIFSDKSDSILSSIH